MERLLAAINEEFRGEILCDELMISHTSWRIGGPAQLFLIPTDNDDLTVLLRLLKSYGVPWLVLGNGTNLLVKDGGIVGAVISLERFDAIDLNAQGVVRVEAGVSLSRLIRATVAGGLKGLEGLTGIPGSVGGALRMNAGTGEMEIGRLVESLTVVSAQGERTLSKQQTVFDYRSLTFPEESVITSACLRLEPSSAAELQEVCNQQRERRRANQNVGGSHAGSVFKNPPDRKAWELIDAAGLRGQRCGDAEISMVHCNRIVNLDLATAQDVLSLIEMTQQRVVEQSGIQLELEVHVVGEEVSL